MSLFRIYRNGHEAKSKSESGFPIFLEWATELYTKEESEDLGRPGQGSFELS